MTAGPDQRVESPPGPMDQPSSAQPAEPAAPLVQPEPLVQPDRDPDVRDLPTSAPVIGKVRPLPPLHIGAGVAHRTPTMVLDGLRTGPFHVAAASQSGTAHLIRGEPRQDAYDFVLTASGRLVVAIADGLGSRPAAQIGARLFCEQVTILAGSTDCAAAEYLVQAAARTSATAETVYGLGGDDISFVAAVAVFTTTEADAVDIARVGDVSAFALATHGSFGELFQPDDAALNVVPTLLPDTGTPVPEQVRTDGAGQIVMTTDGLATDLRNSASLRDWLAQQWRLPVGPYAMAETLRYRRQGSHDDRTAVVVWRRLDRTAER